MRNSYTGDPNPSWPDTGLSIGGVSSTGGGLTEAERETADSALPPAKDMAHGQAVIRQIFREIEETFECPDGWQDRWQALKNRWCGKMPEEET